MDANRKLFHEKIDVSTIGRLRHMQAISADSLVESGYDVVFMPFHTVHPDNDLEEIRVIRNLMKRDAQVVSRPGSPEGGLRGLAETSESILEDRRVISRKIRGRVTEVRQLISTEADRLANKVRRLVDPQSRTEHPLQGTRTR